MPACLKQIGNTDEELGPLVTLHIGSLVLTLANLDSELEVISLMNELCVMHTPDV